MPDFEVFDKDRVVLRHVPTITVLKCRVLSLNRAAYLALEQPDAVELLFDRVKRIIGLRAVPAATAHASFVRSAGRSPNGPFLVSAMSFLGHYGVDTHESRRWPSWIENGVLCVSLEDEYEVVTSARGARASMAAADPTLGPDLDAGIAHTA